LWCAASQSCLRDQSCTTGWVLVRCNCTPCPDPPVSRFAVSQLLTPEHGGTTSPQRSFVCNTPTSRGALVSSSGRVILVILAAGSCGPVLGRALSGAVHIITSVSAVNE